MTVAALLSLSEYLGRTYRPDRDYLDGELRERNVGQWEHARVQYLLAAWFSRHEQEWAVQGSTEQRMRVAPTRIRIADLAIMRPGPQPPVTDEPPLLVIEVLSPDDRYWELEERCADYFAMGVRTVWIIDPKTRTGRMCSGAEWVAAPVLRAAGTPLYVELAELFAGLG